MRIKLLLSILIICFSLFNCNTFAQEDYSLSVFYKYTKRLNTGRLSYPLGFGSSIARKISDKLILGVGFDYGHLYDENLNKFTPSEYRTREIFKESIFSFSAGLSYPVLDRRIIVKIGGDLVSSYFHNSWKYYRYTVANDQMDYYLRRTNDIFGFGIKGKIDFQYPFSSNMSILIQPGYTYYMSGEVKGMKFFNGSAGLIFSF